MFMLYLSYFDTNEKPNMHILLMRSFTRASKTAMEIFAFDFEFEKWKLMALCTVLRKKL